MIRQSSKGGQGADDLAFESLLDHFGDQSRMVHVGMGQQDILECLGAIFGYQMVSLFDIFPTLKHTAIDQKSAAAMFQ